MQTKRLTNPGAEELLGVETKVLDHGYIKLVDYLGRDETVVAAARHSYGKGLDLNDIAGNKKLIEFLMREQHTSPFEQCALVFEVKAPIFVYREWHRHRTAKLNEMSGRYMELPAEFYVPEWSRIQKQSKKNKQGSDGEVHPRFAAYFRDNYEELAKKNFDIYKNAIEGDIAREVARIGLPLSTYSVMVWQCDLHNLLHFLRLRMAPSAQWEIRQFANAMGEAVKQSYPMVWAAFEEHVLHAKKFSRSEVKELEKLIRTYISSQDVKWNFTLSNAVAKLGIEGEF